MPSCRPLATPVYLPHILLLPCALFLVHIVPPRALSLDHTVMPHALILVHILEPRTLGLVPSMTSRTPVLVHIATPYALLLVLIVAPRTLVLVHIVPPRTLSLDHPMMPCTLVLVHTALNHDVPDFPRPGRTPRPWPHLVSVTPAGFLFPPRTPRALVLVLPLVPRVLGLGVLAALALLSFLTPRTLALVHIASYVLGIWDVSYCEVLWCGMI